MPIFGRTFDKAYQYYCLLNPPQILITYRLGEFLREYIDCRENRLANIPCRPRGVFLKWM